METRVHTLVSACPGSGKTRVLSTKSCFHIHADGAVVGAVTFTRDSATEIGKRVSSMGWKGAGRSNFMAGTFHSLSLGQLRDNNKLKGLRIISAGEQNAIIRRAWMLVNSDLQFEDAVKAIESFKSIMSPNLNGDTADIAIFREYQRILSREKCIDFADMLLMSVRMMREGEIDPLPVDYLLVDEAQDMDDVQYHWILAHSLDDKIVTIVGDDDQSIYGWRHAMGFEGMMRFQKEHSAVHVSLSTNYRSDSDIIGHASRLVSFNTERVEKKMRPSSQVSGDVKVIKSSSRVAEVSRIVEAVLSNKDAEWGILSRTNRLLDLVQLMLRANGVEFKRVGGADFWDAVEPSVYFGLLRSIETGNPSGVSNVLHWANVPDKALEGLSHSNITDGLRKVLENLDANQHKAQAKIVKGLIALIPEWASMLAKGRISLVAGGAAVWLSSFTGAKTTSMIDRCAEIVGRLSGSIAQRVNFLTRKKPSKEENSKVTLMTIHSSKGLEFDNVWVLGVEEGVLPHLNAPTQEERRLAYVAFTRARHNLIISHTLENAVPSRFIDEAGLH